MKNYKGVIIEESLQDTSLFKDLKILETKVEPISPKHKTPWLGQWTLHIVEIPENKAKEIAEKISHSFDKKHPNWYVDYKNDKYHFIIFSNKVFKVDRNKPTEYNEVKKYGMSIGIPDYQLDFSPHIKV